VIAQNSLRTGGLALTAIILAMTIALERHQIVPRVLPGIVTLPAPASAEMAAATAPMAVPTPTPTSVPVYDASAVLASAMPRIETVPEAAPRIELPPPPPPRVRAEARPPRPPEPPRPQTPAREATARPSPERPSELPTIEPQTAPPSEPQQVLLAPPAQAAKAAPAGGLRAGRYPALDVDFQTIGLDSYVRATEAAGGAFFAYLGTRGIGPQVSLVGGRITRPARQADLAVERPYLVTDPAIQSRLQDLALPEGASMTSVVMLWPRDLDARAWRAIEDALRDESIFSDQVAQIDARFGESSDRPEIQILGFTMIGDGGRRRLPHPRRVTVPSS
jgi:outer membrane biosynthesis protein TonB